MSAYTYKQLVAAMAEHLVACNIASHGQLKDEGETAEYDAIRKDFPNYGTDQETVRMVMEGAMFDCAELAKKIQEETYKHDK